MHNHTRMGITLAALLVYKVCLASGTAIPGGNQSSTFVIDQPGAYYLAADRIMISDADGITIKSHDVTIDLNGYAIRYNLQFNPGGNHTGSGVKSAGYHNIEIRNGSLADIPGKGVSLDNALNVSRDVRLIDVRCLNIGTEGIHISGYANIVILRCSVDTVQHVYTGGNGIFIDGSVGNLLISQCAIANCNIGIQANYSSANILGATMIDHCVISDCGTWGVLAGGGGATSVTDCVISGINRTKNYVGSGLYLVNATAQNNTISNCGGIGITVIGSILEGNKIMFTSSPSDGSAPVAIYYTGRCFLANNRYNKGTQVLSFLSPDQLTDGGGNVAF